ncbi:hypothetical protein MUP77_19800 [Candidatus Bathyarchaeota archaeon]|nr:hypothetical protein [Candidatus Bathyarchaeota archaeon]
MNKEKKMLAVILISTIILLSFFFITYTIPQPQPSIFPLWIVDANNSVPPSEMNVTLGKPNSLVIGAQNLMGKQEDCLLLVKLRNMSSSLPFSGNSSLPAESSSLPYILNFSFALENNEMWEMPFNFTINGEENLASNNVTVNSLVIDNSFYNYSLKSISDSDSEIRYQFFFELWLKDQGQNSYLFSGIWVSSPFLRIVG